MDIACAIEPAIERSRPLEIVDKLVHDDAHILTVEFVGDGGNVVSARMSRHEDDGVTKINAEALAKGMLFDVVNTDIEALLRDVDAVGGPSGPTVTTADRESPAAASLREEREAKKSETLDDQLDGGLASSFPASDPVSVATTTIPGGGP